MKRFLSTLKFCIANSTSFAALSFCSLSAILELLSVLIGTKAAFIFSARMSFFYSVKFLLSVRLIASFLTKRTSLEAYQHLIESKKVISIQSLRASSNFLSRLSANSRSTSIDLNAPLRIAYLQLRQDLTRTLK